MWDRISALATVVAIPVSIWLAIWGIRARRESEGHLDYEFITGIRLLALEAAQLPSEIKVVCGDQLIADPYLLLVRIINVGRRDVSEEDFKGEMCTIRLDKPVRSVEVVKKSDPQMTAQTEWEGTEARLAPTLFKPDEWLALAILTDGAPVGRSVDVRAPGIAKPREYKPPEYRELASNLGFVAGFIAFVVLVLVANSAGDYATAQFQLSKDASENIVGVIGLVGLPLVVIFGRQVSKWSRKWLGRKTEAMKVF